MPRGRPKKSETVKLVGPELYKRDDNGLLQNVDYSFNDDGSINWRAMIKEEHLFPNKSWFEARGKDCPKSIDDLADHQLLIKLGGIKELAKLRGFTNVGYTFKKCEEEHVAVTCGISFIANYETAGQEVYFEDAANATLNNTSSFATKFLETIACNRAFVRCVRNFLNVHIVGDDEIDKSNKPVSNALSPLSPNAVLENSFTNFELFKSRMRELWASGSYQNTEVKDWKNFSSIPPKEARILLKLLK